MDLQRLIHVHVDCKLCSLNRFPFPPLIFNQWAFGTPQAAAGDAGAGANCNTAEKDPASVQGFVAERYLLDEKLSWWIQPLLIDNEYIIGSATSMGFRCIKLVYENNDPTTHWYHNKARSFVFCVIIHEVCYILHLCVMKLLPPATHLFPAFETHPTPVPRFAEQALGFDPPLLRDQEHQCGFIHRLDVPLGSVNPSDGAMGDGVNPIVSS